MLLYANSTFLQVLEGPDEVVDELIETIKKDPRHTFIQMLHRKPIERREYSDWFMGSKKLSDKDLKEIDGLRHFGEKDFNPDYLRQHASVVQSIMDHYRGERVKSIGHSELGVDEDDPMINVLHRVIRGAVSVLGVLIGLTILWGVVDVFMVLYSKILE